MSSKHIYLFREGNSGLWNLLGGKGANLAEMCSLGIPVPPGFTLPTALCTAYYDAGERLTKEVESAINEGWEFIEEGMGGPLFGDAKAPLLLSVRSGAPQSMPGMMDTILNLGLNDKTVLALASKTSNMRFAKDSYRRFIQMYSNVVMGVEAVSYTHLTLPTNREV